MQFTRRSDVKAKLLFPLSALILLACSSDKVINIHNTDLVFTDIQSDFVLKDINNYDCSEIDISTLKYVLTNGTLTSQREIHDDFSTVGCSIDGQLLLGDKRIDFMFDYGGIFYFKDDNIIACGKDCCRDGFEFCSWDKIDEPNK